MNKTSVFKRILAGMLAMTMLFMTACSSSTGSEETSTDESEKPITTYSSTTDNVKKSETVYVNVNSDGSPKLITVSDWLHADKDKVAIKDSTTLDSFSVTKGQASSVNDDGNITWQMDTSDVYYEGESSAALPVSVSIKYFLDDKEMKASDIAGKSGTFRMEISMKNNISKEVTINNKKVKMYTPFIAIGGMILSYDNFSNIEVKNGMSVGGGSNEVVVLAGAPGLNESLNLSNMKISGFENFSFPESFTVTATVKDFALSDIYFAAMPVSSLNLDADLPKSLEDVKNVLGQLQNLESLLDTIDPNNVLSTFITDGTSLKEMMTVVQDAVGVYQDNQKLLQVFSQYLTPENIKTLSDFMDSLDTEQMKSLLSLMSNVPALSTLVDSLLKLSTGLSDVKPILQGLSDALDDPDIQKSLTNLPQTLDTISELTDYLEKNKDVLNVLTKLMDSSDMKDLTNTLDGIISDANISSGSTDVSAVTDNAQELVVRMDEWLKFDYRIFTSAPENMKTSVMFIFKTSPIG